MRDHRFFLDAFIVSLPLATPSIFLALIQHNFESHPLIPVAHTWAVSVLSSRPEFRIFHILVAFILKILFKADTNADRLPRYGDIDTFTISIDPSNYSTSPLFETYWRAQTRDNYSTPRKSTESSVRIR